MTATANQMSRTEQMFRQMAQEDIAVEQIGASLYVYGSELACLRIFHNYRHGMGKPELQQPRVEFSKNLDTWYFSLPL